MTTETGVKAVTLEADGRVARFRFSDGLEARFHAIWLRDNAQDAETRDAGNGQRLIRIEDVPAETALVSARPGSDGVELVFTPDDHATTFDGQWLRAHIHDRQEDPHVVRPPGTAQPWTGKAGNGLAVHDFCRVSNEDGPRLAYLDDLVRLGAAVVGNAPSTDGTVLRIAELGGPVRETNYGRLFDVRAEPNPINLAYSGLGLQAHTDNPYRDPAPTVQVLHCLENSVEGGETTLVDGFAASLSLYERVPEAVDLLSRYPARFRFNGDPEVDLQARRPMIELSADGELLAVRFNNRSAAPATDIPFDRIPDWYEAWRAFSKELARPEFSTTFRLDPGMAFAVDNRRVLHARTAFSSTGCRWLQGCYADMDAVESSWRVLGARP